MAQLRIRKLAEERGFNITTLSRKAALAYTTTYALWHGSAKLWSPGTLDRIAQALEVRVVDLLEEEAPAPTR